jgi:hypothetical protein
MQQSGSLENCSHRSGKPKEIRTASDLGTDIMEMLQEQDLAVCDST